MTTYIVERMTTLNYEIRMMGGYMYETETLLIQARNPKEAVEKAQKADYVVNKYNLKEVIDLKEKRVTL